MEKECGFGKGKRITDDREIKKVLQEGQVYSGSFLKIHYLQGVDQRFSIRLQAHIKGGYNRNRLRRRLREITRQASLELKNGLYIIWGRKIAIGIGYHRLKRDFEKVIGEGNLWRD